MSTITPNYTNISDIKNTWLESIAPNYFDFDNTNNYQSGIFGYINEVMAEAVEDGFNSVTIARKEFYPVTAQYISSFYKMASMQQVSLPMTTPARCNVSLAIPQKQILENSTINDGVYECTIDSTLQIYADNLQFMLDYPIKILSTKSDDGTYVHVIHYDTSINNSLSNADSETYISNKVMDADGTKYLILFIKDVRQLEMTTFSQIIQRDSGVNTVTFEKDFEGDIANFEVFYKESQNSKKIQLKKVLRYSNYPGEPFICYEFITSNKIRFTFPDNSAFTPGYNSEVIVNIYTSQGEAGNFELFSGQLTCSNNSEDYPYNANFSIFGYVNASATGGRAKMTDDEFRNEVIKAYATNNVHTIANDLQMYFDDESNAIENVNLMFRKKRDDAFIRLFGSYALMKDASAMVIPTNTVNLNLHKTDLVDRSDNVTRIMIKPGTIFEYIEPESETNFDLKINNDISILDIDDNTSMYFINPFLVGINISPNLVGYYLNSIDSTKSVDYTYVNDQTTNQFSCTGIKFYRNAINGSNYYEITTQIIPASEIFNPDYCVTKTDVSLTENMIVATDSGRIVDKTYVYDDDNQIGYVEYTYKYNNGTVGKIQGSTAIKPDNSRVIGYNVLYEIGEDFVVGDIIATKKDIDLGSLTIVGDINNELYANELYIPFVLDSYNDTDGYFEFKAYLATDDDIGLNAKFNVTHGIFDINGEENSNLAINNDNCIFNFCALYNNPGNNLNHKYSTFKNLEQYTMTNMYSTDSNDLIAFIESYTFIRSTVTFVDNPEDAYNYGIEIKELPMLQAWWASKEENYSYFINKINSINEALLSISDTLENNFSIDLKFYNTFGKSRFYKVGNNNEGSTLLDSIRCRFRFGISVMTLTSQDTFLSRFRAHIKSYIEDTTNITVNGQSTYIMNLIADLKKTFSEVIYIEYYGFNKYDHMAQKIIGPSLDKYTEDYIPEFINIGVVYTDEGEAYPDISITLIDE